MLTLRGGAAAAAAVLAGGPGAILDQRSSNTERRKWITHVVTHLTFHCTRLTKRRLFALESTARRSELEGLAALFWLG